MFLVSTCSRKKKPTNLRLSCRLSLVFGTCSSSLLPILPFVFVFNIWSDNVNWILIAVFSCHETLKSGYKPRPGRLPPQGVTTVHSANLHFWTSKVGNVYSNLTSNLLLNYWHECVSRKLIMQGVKSSKLTHAISYIGYHQLLHLYAVLPYIYIFFYFFWLAFRAKPLALSII